jgi:cytochrome c nitrite reductase small subunit
MSLLQRIGKTPLILAVLLGIVVGVGAYTFDYGEGLSYFSTDPKACVNCHIMNDQYVSWQKAGHHQSAVCVDCHLPHEFVPKYLAKADNGWRHSKAFTLQDFHEPIQITSRNADILQANCIRCHGDFVHELVVGARSPTRDSVQCVHCHRGVGHGARM